MVVRGKQGWGGETEEGMGKKREEERFMRKDVWKRIQGHEKKTLKVMGENARA